MHQANFPQILSRFRSLEKKLDDEEVVEDTSFAHNYFLFEISNWKFQELFLIRPANFPQILSRFRWLEKKLDD